MDFELSEDQKGLLALVREYCKKEDPTPYLDAMKKVPLAKTVDELRANFPWQMFENLDKVGLRQLAVPTKYGGGGLCTGEHLTRVLLIEEASYVNPIVSLLIALFLRYIADVVEQGTPDQQDRIFPAFMENKKSSFAVAQSEPEGMSDIVLGYDEPAGQTMRVKAKRDGDGWLINGNKFFCTAGGIADNIMVSVRTDDKAHISKAMSWFNVNPYKMPGVTMNINRTALPGQPWGDVQCIFDNVRVTDDDMVGVLNDAWPLRSTRIGTKIDHWIQLVAFSRSIMEQTVIYAKQRISGGKPIIHHSMVASMIGEAFALIESCRALIYRAACEYDKCERAGSALIPVSKGFMSAYLSKRMMMRITEICSDIWGGVGWENGMPLPGYALSALTFQHPGMTPHVNLLKATKALLNENSF